MWDLETEWRSLPSHKSDISGVLLTENDDKKYNSYDGHNDHHLWKKTKVLMAPISPTAGININLNNIKV